MFTKEKIRNAIIKNKIVRNLYRFRAYSDIGNSQLSWITSQFVTAMSILYLLEKMGIPVGKWMVIFTLSGMLLGYFTWGFVWKKLGIYDTEIYTKATINPWEEEVLAAARRINNGKR